MSIVTSIITGHWDGYYEYDSCYDVAESKAGFRMVLQDMGDGRFSGKCIDLEGAGLNSEVALVEGFMENSFISFTKQYPVFYELDEEGNEMPIPSNLKPLLTYMGQYNWSSKTFSGTWEILMEDEFDKAGNMVVTATGTWKMSKA